MNRMLIMRRLTAGLLVLVLLMTGAGCGTKDVIAQGDEAEETTEVAVSAEVSAEVSSEPTESEDILFGKMVKNKAPNTNVFFGNRKSYYEYDNDKLNEAIDAIKAIRIPEKINVKKCVREELESLKELDAWTIPKIDFAGEYSWFTDGHVDTDKLYEHIVRNNLKAKMSVNSTVRMLIRTEAKAVDLCYKYLLKKYPEVNANRVLYWADQLKVNTIDNEENVSLYTGDDVRIGFNMANISSDDVMLQAACHETFHMTFSNIKITSDHPFYSEGPSLDSLTNVNSFMCFEFIGEYVVDTLGYYASGVPFENAYYDKEQKIDLIGLSTGLPIEYFYKAFMTNDQNGLISAMEPELQDFETAYSIYGYANALSGLSVYENMDAGSEEYLQDFYKQFQLLLYKNITIRLIKDYGLQKIDYETLQSSVTELNDRLLLINVWDSDSVTTDVSKQFLDILEPLITE